MEAEAQHLGASDSYIAIAACRLIPIEIVCAVVVVVAAIETDFMNSHNDN